jgi:hypothetical protein
MKIVRSLLVATCLLLPAIPAQGGLGDDKSTELARLEREKAQRVRDVENLVDMRMRLDLGLPAEEDPTAPRPQGPITTDARDRMMVEWREQDRVTATLAERYKQAKQILDQALAENAKNAASRGADDSYLVVPQAGTAAPSRQPAQGTQAPRPVASEGSNPAAESAAALATGVYSPLDKPRGLIQGSTDHLRVGQALFKAGQRLAEAAATARELHRPEEAQDLDQRAQERLQLALVELAPLLAEKTPSFSVLFYQGRALELLFRYSERYEDLSLAHSTRDYQRREQEVRDPFLRITARDVTKGGKGGEVEQLGSWGMAAQAAMDHFKWMNLNGNYKPKIDIESITWPGEKDQ